MISVPHWIFIWTFTFAGIHKASCSPIDEADLFFGTEKGGNVFPGSTRPFGMVKMGVDVIHSRFGDAYSGYAPDGKVVAVSMMHESGTGGAPEYGVAAQLPFLGEIDYTRQAYLSRARQDIASPGYYSTLFDNGIHLELAAAYKAGFYRYTFPSTIGISDGDQQGKPIHIIVNGSAHLIAPQRPWWTQYFVGGKVEYHKSTQHYEGEVRLTGGWGEQNPWKFFYCGDFDTEPIKVIRFKGHDHFDNQYEAEIENEKDGSMGLVFEFPQNTSNITSRVGVSFISSRKACYNLHKELDDKTFDDIQQDSIKIWNKEVFDKVEISTTDPKITQYIYTSLYGAHLLPSDRSGENPNWHSKEPYYDDWFTLWDTFRCLNPLFNVLNPKRAAELIRSLIDIYRFDGFLPDGRSANQNGRTQGGSNADVVIADAFIKNIDDGHINWEEAFMALRNDAEQIAPYQYDSFSPDASTKEGRGGVTEWIEYGFVTRNYTRSVTRTMEYSYNDFAISVVARGLGKNEQAAKFLRRSSNWQNIWNFEATSETLNYTGFVQPKNADGTFNPNNYDPLSCGASCYWHDDEYEGLPVEYGWSVPHDIATLHQFIGSNDTFMQRLDDMFGLYGRAFSDIGNEPSFLTPFLYNFINRQYRTVETIRYLVNTHYHTGPQGLPGNSDAGSMQAWLFWSLIGIYPVAGTTTYLLASPFLPYSAINLSHGTKLEISANSHDFDKEFFVQNVTLNGQPLYRNWVTHDEIFNGNQSTWLHFELGAEPVVWETDIEPPSPGHVIRNITADPTTNTKYVKTHLS